MSVYRPTFRYQIGDPTTTADSRICTMESGAMALDYHTRGLVKVWGGQLYARQYDRVGGTDLNDLKVAWAAYGYTFTNKTGSTFLDLMADLRAGRGVVCGGDYDVFSLAERCQDSFLGDHAIYLNPEFDSRGYILRGDPLCKGFDWISPNSVKRYAEKLGHRKIPAPSGEPQPIYYGVTRPWAPLPDTATEGELTIGDIVDWNRRTVTVKGSGHSIIRLSDAKHQAVAAGTAKTSGAKVKLAKPLDSHAGDRVTGYLVRHNGAAGFLLAVDAV